jgi:hypothetical protein
VAYAHWDYAYLLLSLHDGNEEHRQLARQHIKALVQLFTANPQNYESGHLGYLRQVASQIQKTGTSAGLPELQMFADASPEFKTFVKQYGIDLK